MATLVIEHKGFKVKGLINKKLEDSLPKTKRNDNYATSIDREIDTHFYSSDGTTLEPPEYYIVIEDDNDIVILDENDETQNKLLKDILEVFTILKPIESLIELLERDKKLRVLSIVSKIARYLLFLEFSDHVYKILGNELRKCPAVVIKNNLCAPLLRK
jgi:hypothetical protein